jgi:hypothetical protein
MAALASASFISMVPSGLTGSSPATIAIDKNSGNALCKIVLSLAICMVISSLLISSAFS